jgi:Zn-dependent protease
LHWTNLLIIPGLLIGYTIHELAHAFVAYFLGDTSQVERGKITLNPFRHISWFGLFAFLLFGIGWPNPLEANPNHFKRKYMDMALIALAGPVASFTLSLAALLLTLSMAALLVYGSGATTDTVLAYLNFPLAANLPQSLNLQAVLMAFTRYIAIANFWLAFISLLPLPGLDGFIIIFSVVGYFRERKVGQPARVASLKASRRLYGPINASQRRNNVSDIHFKLGAEYHEAQQYDDAIARYRQAISADRHFGPAYVNLGLAYLGKGRRREAIQAFRGAVQQADDQKSQGEAWYQLHQLSEVSPVDENEAKESMAELGASPWTDTKPRPNWLGLGISCALLLIAGIFFYGYLLSSAIEALKA